ncbi:hypothetical protein EVA_20117 [gut metagenome]|uniref:Uncharacterized protein n=1 Tax=gut metagenome TaxID=749906 RepID=J9FA39_9ZZZZ
MLCWLLKCAAAVIVLAFWTQTLPDLPFQNCLEFTVVPWGTKAASGPSRAVLVLM